MNETEKPSLESLMPIIRTIAKRYARLCRYSVRGSLDESDLVQAGSIGAMRALKHYDPAQGIPLRAYAVRAIRWDIQRCVTNSRSAIRVPEKEQAKRARRGEARAPRCASLDAPLCQETAEPLIEFIAAPDESSDLREQALRASLVSEALERLPARQREVIRARFWDGRLREDVAKERGLCPQSISNIEARAMRDLKRWLKEFAPTPAR